MAAHKMPDGRWCVWLDLGDDPATGRRVRKRVEAKTKRLCEIKAAEVRERMGRGEDVAARPRLLRELFDDWLTTVERQGKAPGTLATYRGVCQNQLAPRFGGMSVPKVRTRELQTHFNQMAAALSAPYVRQAKTVLVMALNYAIEQGERLDNPARVVRVPAMSATAGRSLTLEEVQAVLAASDAHRLGLAVRLGLLGLRRSEIPALRWEGFDEAAGTLRVTHQLRPIGGRWVLVGAKRGGTRLLTLDAGLIARLVLQRRAQAVECKLMGWEPCPYIIHSARTGSFCPPGTVAKAFQSIARMAQIDPARLHDLRHTAATALLGAREDIGTVSGVLGHASPEVTARIYAHALPHRVAEASARLGDLERLLGATEEGRRRSG